MRKKLSVKPTLLDKAIAYISPKAGAARLRDRYNFGLLSSFGVTPAGSSTEGNLSGWIPQRMNRFSERVIRERMSDRVDDLVANDCHAASTVDSLTLNTVGSGLRPQSRPKFEILGITEEQAQEFAMRAEWEFNLWAKTADITGRFSFGDMQYANFRSVLVRGEFLNVVTRHKDAGSRVGYALQMLDTRRLSTPSDLSDNEKIRDGILFGSFGQPLGYYIASPDDGLLNTYLDSSQYRKVRAKKGHQKKVFHEFFLKDPEAVRGTSILAPAVKAFKNLDDYLDFELVGAIVAASMPIFVEVPNISEGSFDVDAANVRYQELSPGQIAYGNPGEKPYTIDPKRPSDSFRHFVERVLRMIGAAAGLPYEVITKDFSQTNYSSARAALLEAWRLYSLYREWMIGHFCQQVWESVLEEAWLLGRLPLPEGGPSFYEAKEAYCAAIWTGPVKGHVDPYKEKQAQVLGLENGIDTLADVLSEQDRDWRDQLQQRGREVALAKELGITQEVVTENAPENDPDDDTDE